MQISRSEFFIALAAWHGRICAIHLHCREINGAVVARFRSTTADPVLEFSAHPALQPLTIDLSEADEFEFLNSKQAPAIERS